MLVSEQAVQAAARKDAEMSGRTFDALSSSEKKRYLLRSQEQLTAALPFLTGVKATELKWVGKTEIKAKTIIGIYLIDQFAEKFRLYPLDRSSYQWFDTLEAAKAAAQSAYEARILSALEPFANSYPQGANLAAHSKNENGPDHEPSPRAQALEEAAQAVEALKGRSRSPQVLQGFGDARREAAAAIRALSSHPVADGWLPIETAPKDGTPVLAYQAGRYFKCWMECDQYEGGYFWQDEEDSEPSPTHWRPLPASPGASE